MHKHIPKQFVLNQDNVKEVISDGTVLLDYLRTRKRLTGTKEGCREGDCGACAVLVGELKNNNVVYRAVNSCLLPMGQLAGKHIITIEGLSTKTSLIQEAIIDENASQCGFCTPGIIIALTGYFLSAHTINTRDAIHALDGNICRCTGYLSIKRAVAHVCAELSKNPNSNRIELLIKTGIIPDYFKTIPQQLLSIQQPQDKTDQNGIRIAGGTDLFVQQPEELESAKISFLPTTEHPVRQKNGNCFIDAAATVTQLQESVTMQELFPNLENIVALISSTPIRNKATVGGNIVNASPIGDLSIFLLAMDASLLLSGKSGERHVKLANFFLDYKKLDLHPGEKIKSIYFKIPDEPFLFNFDKVSKRRHLDIASVNSAMFLQLSGDYIKNIHISAGGVAPIPLYLSQTTTFLADKKIDPGIIENAAQIAVSEISPISDVRGSAEYKRTLLRRLLAAHFIALAPDKCREIPL